MTKRPLLLVAALIGACAVEPSPAERTTSAPSAIVNGTESDESQDAIVLVMHYDALQEGGGAASGCTGTLLAPNLVLTARHCVATTDPGAACNSKGEPVAGGAVESDHAPSAIFVFAGKERPDFISGNVRLSRGKELLSTGAKTLCDNDIALVILDRPLDGGTIAPIRLDEKPSKGELVTIVGWGIADDDPSPMTRRQRTDVEIVDVGPAFDLGPTEFRIGEGTCQGDSGGPALSASGAVIGALSRGGNGKDVSGADACLDGTNIFTSTAGHAAFLRAGYERAGYEPWLEGESNPQLAKNGEACQSSGECRSNVCDAERKRCADGCVDGACPVGFECLDQGAQQVCRVAPVPEDVGCSVSARRTRGLASEAPPSLLLAIGVMALVTSARRRTVSDGSASRCHRNSTPSV